MSLAMPASAHAPEAFAPELLAVQARPPARTPRLAAYVVGGLFALLAVWAAFGRLDIVASAPGRLVPRHYSRVVQPAEAGVLRDILVREGEFVLAGQVLIRMDTTVAGADQQVLEADAALQSLRLRRIDAELAGRPFEPRAQDPPALASQVLEQYRSRRRSHLDAVAQEQATLDRALHDLAAARQQLAKLQTTLPLYQQSARSYEALVKDGFVSELGANEKLREKLEKEQESKAQEASVKALEYAVEQARRRLAQVHSTYESQLQQERLEILTAQQRNSAERSKHAYRSGLLELRAPADGVVQDLVTYTRGAVVQPGTVLLHLVPKDEPLLAEVAVRNEDAGFVAAGQKAKVKLTAYPFQRYGMLEGEVEMVSPDSLANDPQKAAAQGQNPHNYKAWIRLGSQQLRSPSGDSLRLTPGMAVQAEIHQGHRTVLEYLLSPVRKVAQEAARER